MADLTALRCFYPENAPKMHKLPYCASRNIYGINDADYKQSTPTPYLEPKRKKKQIGDAYDTQSCTDNSCCPLCRHALHEPGTGGIGSSYLLACHNSGKLGSDPLSCPAWSRSSSSRGEIQHRRNGKRLRHGGKKRGRRFRQ